MRRLLIRPGAIGDVILSLPALEHARADFTEVWVPRPAVPLIRFADRVRPISSTGLDLLSVTEDARVPELETFDSIYSWYGSNRAEFRDAVRDLPFTFFPALPSDSSEHAADFLLRQVGGDPPARPRIPTPCWREEVAAIHPFSGSSRKNWPLDNFRELAGRLDLPVRWCAGPEDALPHEAVRIENLYELARWLAGVAVYIGNDSGITHLAAASGAPTVAIFLSTDPRVWAPRGPRVAICEQPSVDDVLHAVREVMRGGSGGFG